jgi:hypothetical protein
MRGVKHEFNEMHGSGEMMTDEEIGEKIRSRGLEEEYIRELMASLGFDPAEGFTNAGIEAIDSATMEQRRRAALRTLAMADEA